MKTSENSNIIQGSFPGGKPHRSVLIQAKVGHSIQMHSNSYKLDSSRLNLSGQGNPLPGDVRQKMESVFGTDFSSVRVHTGPQAESIGAIAFTMGHDIYFANGQYNPHTSHGQRLLGHELTHVVQQRNGRVRNPYGGSVAVVNDPGLEAEAERMGLRAIQKKCNNICSPIQTKAGMRVITNQGQWENSKKLSVLVDGRTAGSVEVIDTNSDTAEIVNLEVNKKFRGQGAGKILIDAARKSSHLTGKANVMLESQDNGSGKLNKWYKSLGFSEIGVGKKGMRKMIASTTILKKDSPAVQRMISSGSGGGGDDPFGGWFPKGIDSPFVGEHKNTKKHSKRGIIESEHMVPKKALQLANVNFQYNTEPTISIPYDMHRGGVGGAGGGISSTGSSNTASEWAQYISGFIIKGDWFTAIYKCAIDGLNGARESGYLNKGMVKAYMNCVAQHQSMGRITIEQMGEINTALWQYTFL